MSAPPPFAVDYDARFVQIDLEGDLGRWADAAARTMWERSGRRHGRGQVRRLAGAFRAMAEAAREQHPLGAFLLAPEPWVGVAAVVKLTPVDLGDADLDRDAVLDELTYPDAYLAEAVEVVDVPTPAGVAARLRQRILEPGSTKEAVESVQYVWFFPHEQAILLMRTAFTDLTEAAPWRTALNALAGGVSLLDVPADVDG